MKFKEYLNENWIIKLDVGKNNPDTFEKWSDEDWQKSHKVDVERNEKIFIIKSKNKKGSSRDWVLDRINKGWSVNPVKILK